MIPQVNSRKIGNVTIIDMKGSLTGFWTERVRKEIEHFLNEQKSQRVVFNLQKVTQMDSLGLKAIFQNISESQEISILSDNRSIVDMVGTLLGSRQLNVIKNEHDIVSFLGKELVDNVHFKERRVHPRLLTALPLEFYRLGEEEPVYFRAVVTNLSLGGLFAEYIDLKHAEQSLERLSPYDLKLLHLRISMPKSKTVDAEGRVAHRRLYGEQLGIGVEFYKISVEDQAEIEDFLRIHEASSES